MAGRAGMKCGPTKGGRDGRGSRICDASGFVRPAGDAVRDARQGLVAREFADMTPGFGTLHPQDVARRSAGTDPQPIPDARPEPPPTGPKELGWTDAMIRRALRLGIPVGRL